jgi:hypothetical protein
VVTIALLVAAALAQNPATPVEQPPDVTVMKAALGGMCTADFTVKDAAGKPVYGASVHVRVRYGFMGVKRADLDVGTSSLGKARVEGLPDKAKPLEWEVQKEMKRASAEQLVESNCNAKFDVTLK